MTSLSEGSIFDFQTPLYEDDVWLQKIPHQLHNFIQEKNRVDSGLVITVFHDSYNKTTDDYITLTMNLLQEKNDFQNSFVMASIMHSGYLGVGARFNTGFMILNNETNNAEYYDFDKFADGKLINRTGNYSGIFNDKNTNWMRNSIRVSAQHDPPTTVIENGKMEGFDGKFLDVICRQLNATYNLIDINKYPKIVFCTDSLAKDGADLCLNTDNYVKRYLKNTEIVNLNIYDEISVLVPADTVINGNTYFRPFDDITWKALIANILISVVVWKILFYIYYRLKKEENVTDVTFNMVELTLTASVAKEPRNKMESIFIISLAVFNFIILVAYSSVLISSLLDPKFENIDTIDQLREANLSFVADKSIITSVYGDMKLLNITKKLLVQEDHYFTEAMTDKFAYIMTKRLAYQYLNSHKNLFEDEIKLHEMKEHFAVVERSIKIHSSLKLGDSIAMIGLRIREAGLDTHWRAMSELKINYLTKKNIHDKLALTQYVGMDELHFMFWFLIVGWLCALTIFLLEHLLQFLKKSLQMFLLKLILQEWVSSGRR
ncbi:unnamed protein product [Diamesa tonsa]